ncbi:hypothetical protein AVEN_80827-1 [Araneus ventricosus]|uniref:Uncharacterized protein n=1 Tax=Araneus ventricosus TaxID=182803 RepID=A0A4Y2NUT6_ARAVE|nr:hypothetical protein AVEN_80827-1 [Araneus ventricosus]
MCAALAFLPEEDIDDAWIKIQEDSPQNFLQTKFYDYFVEQWIENRTITVSMWNCFKRLHRTNDIIEGWNNKVNAFIDTGNECIRNLSVLGLETNPLTELVIINHCIAKLQDEIVHRWELTSNPDSFPTIKERHMFIEKKQDRFILMTDPILKPFL